MQVRKEAREELLSTQAAGCREQLHYSWALAMEPCRALALCLGSLSLVAVLVALGTDFWFVAIGPHSMAHSGLWDPNLADAVRGQGEHGLRAGGRVGAQG